MAAAEPADLALHAALFVAALLARAAEETIKAIMGSQRDEPLGLLPIPPLAHAGHRRFQVVVADPSWDGTEMLQGQHVPF